MKNKSFMFLTLLLASFLSLESPTQAYYRRGGYWWGPGIGFGTGLAIGASYRPYYGSYYRPYYDRPSWNYCRHHPYDRAC